jgi:Dolichyl-phosphate-mannose-protein mannosyltransferase
MTGVPTSTRHRSGIRPELVITTALLCGTVVVGFATLRDYGIALDEWNADEYGVKALAWYTSGFNDRGMFNDVEETLWYYGPWFQILTALIQALDIAGHWTTRHAVTLVTGIVGIAMLVPLARRVAGPWAGLTAIILCLTTGYLYGNLFCTPIDIPFLFAMTAATVAIVIMAERTVPSWKATISAGLLMGLAIATRSFGIITQTYLVGAMALSITRACLDVPAGGSRLSCGLAFLRFWAAPVALSRGAAFGTAGSALFAPSRAGSGPCSGPLASTPIAARPRLVMHSASEPSASSRRHSGGVPPEGTSSTSFSRKSFPATFVAAAPFSSSLIAPCCAADDSSTSCGSESLLPDMIEISIRLQRRHAPSPPKPRTRPKPAGQDPERAYRPQRRPTLTLCSGQKASPFCKFICNSKRCGPAAPCFSASRAARCRQMAAHQSGMQRFEACRLSHGVRSRAGLFRRGTPAKRP